MSLRQKYIRREPVESETFISVGYDPGEKILQLEFRAGGRIYEYFDVPAYIHADMMKAPSKGRFFHEHILNEFEYALISAR